jgi:hypothetical protein
VAGGAKEDILTTTLCRVYAALKLLYIDVV